MQIQMIFAIITKNLKSSREVGFSRLHDLEFSTLPTRQKSCTRKIIRVCKVKGILHKDSMSLEGILIRYLFLAQGRAENDYVVETKN